MAINRLVPEVVSNRKVLQGPSTSAKNPCLKTTLAILIAIKRLSTPTLTPWRDGPALSLGHTAPPPSLVRFPSVSSKRNCLQQAKIHRTSDLSRGAVQINRQGKTYCTTCHSANLIFPTVADHSSRCVRTAQDLIQLRAPASACTSNSSDS